MKSSEEFNAFGCLGRRGKERKGKRERERERKKKKRANDQNPIGVRLDSLGAKS